MKLGDKVKVISGDYYGQVGVIIDDLRGEGASYPITVEFPNGEINGYYEEHLTKIEQ